MSRYEWAAGTIKLPSDQWSAFRKALINRHNEYLHQAYLTARKIHEEIKSDSRYKRDYGYSQAVNEKLYTLPNMSFPEHIRHLISNSLLDYQDYKFKLKLPKKKDFPKANLKTTRYGMFVLDHEEKSMYFSVEENNHAVDRAFEDKFVSYVFKLLDNVTWTRSSGGTIVGNDEYNRESEYEGGGGNYVVRKYGNKKERFFNAYYN